MICHLDHISLLKNGFYELYISRAKNPSQDLVKLKIAGELVFLYSEVILDCKVRKVFNGLYDCFL